MKNWMLVLPVAALILGGAAACERKDTTTAAQQYSRNDTTGEADTRAGAANNPNTAGSPSAQGQLRTHDTPTAAAGAPSDRVAPQQADLDELDGEQVTVVIDTNGRVMTIEIAADREG